MIQLDNAVERFGKVILNELKEAKVVCWVAGGSLRDYFSGVYQKTDYDLFFPNQEEYDKAYKYFREQNCLVKWESDNGCKVVHDNKTFDLVKKFFSTPKETIDAFDFTVSMFAVDEKEVYFGDTSFIDLAKRQLMINKITYPASTMNRAFRYYKKGYSMCLGEMRKLFDSIQNMPKPEAEKEEKTNEEEVSSGDAAAFWSGID